MEAGIKARIVYFAPHNLEYNFYCIEINRNHKGVFSSWEKLLEFDKDSGKWTELLITWTEINAYWRSFVENMTTESYEEYMNKEKEKERRYHDKIKERQESIIAKNYK